MFLWILALWVIDISQFTFMFLMSLTVTVINVYLSVRIPLFFAIGYILSVHIYSSNYPFF